MSEAPQLTNSHVSLSSSSSQAPNEIERRLACMKDLRERVERAVGWPAALDACLTPTCWFQLDEEVLSRFLIAKNWNVDKAAIQLVSYLNMRKLLKPCRLNESDPKFELVDPRYWRYLGDSFALDRAVGHPVEMVEIAHYRTWMFKNTEEFQEYQLVIQERRGARMKQRGQSKSIVLLDASGWQHAAHSSPTALLYVRRLVHVMQEWYPETLLVGLVYRAPLIFKWAWSVIRPFLDPVTAKRIVFVRDDEHLRELVDPGLLLSIQHRSSRRVSTAPPKPSS